MGIVERIIGIIAEEASVELLAKIDRMLAIRLSQSSQAILDQIKLSEEPMSILADKIKSLVAVETAEGALLIQANTDLKAALDAAKARIAELELIANSVPGLQEQLNALKADLASADEAATAIAGINPTPVADGVIDEVIGNPALPVPPVVDEAPIPTDETIPATPVVEAAIDTLDSAATESSFQVSPG